MKQNGHDMHLNQYIQSHHSTQLINRHLWNRRDRPAHTCIYTFTRLHTTRRESHTCIAMHNKESEHLKILRVHDWNQSVHQMKSPWLDLNSLSTELIVLQKNHPGHKIGYPFLFFHNSQYIDRSGYVPKEMVTQVGSPAKRSLYSGVRRWRTILSLIVKSSMISWA